LFFFFSLILITIKNNSQIFLVIKTRKLAVIYGQDSNWQVNNSQFSCFYKKTKYIGD
jgi:hypothetical protein